MGFGREARRVRDQALPHRYRLGSLSSCIELIQPIGYHATWSYLETKSGRDRRDIAFLEPAIDFLEVERAAFKRIAGDYATLRIVEKRAGRRTPRPNEVKPDWPFRWHGDEKMGALCYLRSLWSGSRWASFWIPHLSEDAVGQLVLAAVETAIDSPPPVTLDDSGLQMALDWTRHQKQEVQRDWEYSRRCRVLEGLLGHLWLIGGGAPVVGEPWNFVSEAER